MSSGSSRPPDRTPFSVTVYASSSARVPLEHFAIAEELGRQIAQRGWRLVFGGGRHGLMGAVSRGAHAAGGEVTGIILQDFIDKNVHCTETREMRSVTDMRLRKRGLDEAGDGYVALPGGYGTYEELFEILSFKQLGFHDKPVVLLNSLGYWDPLLTMIERSFELGFIQGEYRELLGVAGSPGEALALFQPGTSL